MAIGFRFFGLKGAKASPSDGASSSNKRPLSDSAHSASVGTSQVKRQRVDEEARDDITITESGIMRSTGVSSSDELVESATVDSEPGWFN